MDYPITKLTLYIFSLLCLQNMTLLFFFTLTSKERRYPSIFSRLEQ